MSVIIIRIVLMFGNFVAFLLPIFRSESVYGVTSICFFFVAVYVFVDSQCLFFGCLYDGGHCAFY